jgi:hypothetical protein
MLKPRPRHQEPAEIYRSTLNRFIDALRHVRPRTPWHSASPARRRRIRGLRIESISSWVQELEPDLLDRAFQVICCIAAVQHERDLARRVEREERRAATR